MTKYKTWSTANHAPTLLWTGRKVKGRYTHLHIESGPNGRHIAENASKYIFINDNILI